MQQWSSNLPDYLTTLVLIQSNNEAPNWGPNHATNRTVELLNRTGSSPSYITVIMVWNPGWFHKYPMLHLSVFFISAHYAGPHADVENLLILLDHDRFLPLLLCRKSVFFVGGETFLCKLLQFSFATVLQRSHLDILVTRVSKHCQPVCKQTGKRSVQAEHLLWFSALGTQAANAHFSFNQ